jgi:hypothetical protein
MELRGCHRADFPRVGINGSLLRLGMEDFLPDVPPFNIYQQGSPDPC